MGEGNDTPILYMKTPHVALRATTSRLHHHAGDVYARSLGIPTSMLNYARCLPARHSAATHPATPVTLILGKISIR